MHLFLFLLLPPPATSYHHPPYLLLSGAAAHEAPVHGSSVLLGRSAAMAALSLGQMLDGALGSAKAGAIDFEMLHSLLNGLLLCLGLRDVPVLENGEPLEGAEAGPFSASFLEDLKRRVEANEKEIAEVEALPRPGCSPQASPSCGVCTLGCSWAAAAQGVLKARP